MPQRVEYMVHMLTALIMEGAEALDHLPWKHWKQYQELIIFVTATVQMR